MKKKNILYLDVLRIIATFAVIAIHVVTLYWNDYDVSTYEWGAFNVFDSISRWAVPIFCMISGYLFLNNEKKISISSLFTKNIARMVITLLVWSVFYAFYNYDPEVLGTTEFIKKIFSGSYHTWYILLAAGFYACVPIFRRITSSKSATQYFIALCIAITFILPNLSQSPDLEWIQRNLSRAFLNLTLGYTPYFFIGYYLAKYDIPKLLKALIYIVGPISFFVIIFGTLSYSQAAGEFDDRFYVYNSICVLFQSCFVFLFAKDFCKGIDLSPKAQKVFSTISKHTFGVYLIHVFVIAELDRLFLINAVTVNPYIAIPAVMIITYAISEIVSAILNFIPIVKKYIV
ncbi:MAG: acyltransferase family protein [Clostridia bacterium]|nr:acyltransferase family protein [Clostridia bacterium]